MFILPKDLILTRLRVFHCMSVWGHKVENAESVKKLFLLPKDSILTRLRDFHFMGENAVSVKKLFILPKYLSGLSTIQLRLSFKGHK